MFVNGSVNLKKANCHYETELKSKTFENYQMADTSANGRMDVYRSFIMYLGMRYSEVFYSFRWNDSSLAKKQFAVFGEN